MQLPSTSFRTWLVCSALAGSGPAWAETSPYYIGVSQGFSSDSNLFRFAEDQPQTHDVVSSTGLVAGIDQPFGRQHFGASGNVRNNRYRDNSQLNNTSFGLNAALDWSTVGSVAGSLAYAASQNQARYGDGVAGQFTGKNIEKAQQATATVRTGVALRLSLESSIEHRSVGYSAVEYNNLDYRQDQVSLGLRYEVSGLLTVGAGLRYAKGKYPQFGATATTAATGDSTERRDLDLTAAWVPTGMSSVNARLSFGRLTRKVASAGGFSGATGSLTWAYTPTGKLSFNTTLLRDTGTETRVYGVNTQSGVVGTAVDDFNRLTTSVQLSANYAFSAKLALNAAVGHSRRALSDTVTVGSTGLPKDGSDTSVNVSLGARYTPSRSGSLACTLGRESRTSSSTLSYAYSANTANCTAQLVLQ